MISRRAFCTSVDSFFCCCCEYRGADQQIHRLTAHTLASPEFVRALEVAVVRWGKERETKETASPYFDSGEWTWGRERGEEKEGEKKGTTVRFGPVCLVLCGPRGSLTARSIPRSLHRRPGSAREREGGRKQATKTNHSGEEYNRKVALWTAAARLHHHHYHPPTTTTATTHRQSTPPGRKKGKSTSWFVSTGAPPQPSVGRGANYPLPRAPTPPAAKA